MASTTTVNIATDRLRIITTLSGTARFPTYASTAAGESSVGIAGPAATANRTPPHSAHALPRHSSGGAPVTAELRANITISVLKTTVSHLFISRHRLLAVRRSAVKYAPASREGVEMGPSDIGETTTGDDAPVLLVGSSGGHLAQLHALRPWWEDRPRRWVTFDKPDARSLLAGETVVWAHHPTTRSIPNLLRNLAVAWRELRRHRPALVISTGAGVALPFFMLTRLFRIPTCYIEVYDRIDTPTLTGRLCAPFTDLFLVQWPEQLPLYRNAQLLGPVL